MPGLCCQVVYFNTGRDSAIKSQFNKLLTNKDKVFITKVNMREQKLDYSYGYNPSSFKDWDEYGNI